jgi:hypothetical protein
MDYKLRVECTLKYTVVVGMVDMDELKKELLSDDQYREEFFGIGWDAPSEIDIDMWPVTTGGTA